MSNLKLCILTLDPFNKGGVLTMTKIFYKIAKDNNLDPFLVYNIVPSLRGDYYKQFDISFVKLYKPPSISLLKEEVFGMKGVGIPRILPEFEFLNYVTNIKLWKKAIRNFNVYFAIGGNNLVALPYIFFKKDFCIWVASTLCEDRIDRMKKQKLLRKIRDYFSLPILLYFEKLVFKKAKKILALSKYTEKKIISKYKFTENKIFTVPYPIDTELFCPLNYKSRTNNYILFTGRFTDPRKNIFLLLNAFLKIKQNYPYIKLKLIGDKLNNPIKKFILKNNLENDIEIKEFINSKELIKYYQDALLFIVPSFQEGLCISALEALACGIPVISTKCGGPEEFIVDGYNGYLVENNNLNSLISKTMFFLGLNDKIKKEMSKNARKFILENYSIKKIKPKFLECLNYGI